jgi:hypothetical protein
MAAPTGPTGGVIRTAPGFDETIWALNETIFVSKRSQPETNARAGWPPLIKREGSIMWAFITSIYRAYCYARLLEMRSNHRHAGHV